MVTRLSEVKPKHILVKFNPDERTSILCEANITVNSSGNLSGWLGARMPPFIPPDPRYIMKFIIEYSFTHTFFSHRLSFHSRQFERALDEYVKEGGSGYEIIVYDKYGNSVYEFYEEFIRSIYNAGLQIQLQILRKRNPWADEELFKDFADQIAVERIMES